MKLHISKFTARVLLPLSFAFTIYLYGDEWFYASTTPWLYSTSTGKWNYMTPSFYYGANGSYYTFDSIRPVHPLENRWLYFVEPFWVYDYHKGEWIILKGTWGYEYDGSGESESSGTWRVYFDPLGEGIVPSTLPMEVEISIAYFSSLSYSQQLISFSVIYVPTSQGGMAHLTPGGGVNTPDVIDALGWNEPVPAIYTKLSDSVAKLELDSLGLVIELEFNNGRMGTITFRQGEESWRVDYQNYTTGFSLGIDYYKLSEILK